MQIRIAIVCRLAVTTALLPLWALPQQPQEPSLRIVSPREGAVVKTGGTIHVTVATVGDFTGMMILGDGSLGDSRGRTKPPWEFSMKIPPRHIEPGPYSLIASGDANHQNLHSDPVDIDVERADAPLKIWTEPSCLDIGVNVPQELRVFGSYIDDPMIKLNRSTRTTLVSEAPNIVKITPQHMILGVSPGKTRVIVDGKLPVEVTVRPH
jgi:hypothetical protein